MKSGATPLSIILNFFPLHLLETFAIVLSVLKVMRNILDLHSTLPWFESNVIFQLKK